MKMKRGNRLSGLKRIGLKLAGGVLAFSLLGSGTAARAQGDDVDEARLQKAVRAEINRMLSDGSFDDAIRKGIGDFIAEQRQQAREREEQALQKKAEALRPVSVEEDHIYGNPDAAITLIEYSDFECPFCKRFHPTARKLVDGSNGEVNWVYRHFPLAFHNPGAQKEAEASECAAELGGKDAFWQYGNRIFERTKSNGKGFPIENLVPLAKEIGLDEEKFAECLDSGRMAEKVKKDYDNGVAAGVSGTPGNFLLHNESGRIRVVTGAVPLQKLQAGVESLRAASMQK